MRGSVARGSCYFAGVRKESDMKTRDMTTGNPLKLLMLFAFPLMLGNVFQQLYTVVDTMVVGQVLAQAPEAALPFTYTVFLCPCVLVWYLLTEAGSIVENAGALGAPIPEWLKRAVAELRDRVDED